MQLNINTDAVVMFVRTLEKINKSALPVAIRGALNKAAFDVKQNTMPTLASQIFKNRSPNFFKANSRVEMAAGFDIKSMKSIVGFTEKGLNGENNFSVKDLEQQEDGGIIRGRSFIPANPARGGSNSKPVRPTNRIGKITKIINAVKAKGINDRQKFVKSAILAGAGGYVIGDLKGKKILWRINSLRKTKYGQFKLTALYSFKNKRSVTVKSTGFMKKASLQSAAGIEEYFIAEAKRQIDKLK